MGGGVAHSRALRQGDERRGTVLHQQSSKGLEGEGQAARGMVSRLGATADRAAGLRQAVSHYGTRVVW